MTHRLTLATLATAVALAFAPAIQAAPSATHSVSHKADIAPAASAPQAQQQLLTLADEYYDAVARFDPVGATQNGDNRFDDQLNMDIVPAERAKHYKRMHAFQQRLKAIARAQLSRSDRINYDVLAFELKSLLATEAFPEHLLPLNQMDSIPVTLANFAGGEASQPLTTVKEYDAYLARLTKTPAWIEQAIANMRTGMAKKVVLPKALMVSALPQYKKLVTADAASSIYYTPVTKMPATFSDADKLRLANAYLVAVNQLNPALERLAAFLETEYLPACRDSSGWSALPQGRAWYLANVAEMTTTTLSPEQIHEIGLKEVARIQQQFAVLGPKLGYDGPAAGLPVWVGKQAKFYPFKTEEEVQAVYHQLNALLDTKLPQMFTLMPKAKLDLRLEPELSRATASDHYTSPSADGSRPGVFWSVVTDPAKYNSTGMNTLFLHEGKPGHHFHIALTMEMNQPKFRKFGGNNAFTEGWALYAETLGKDMGLFDDPAQYFGHLNDELLRAVRLVVDTGLHAKGWSREKTIAYMYDALGDADVAKNQTERYMAWPGQALGYKIGSLKIMELREKAKRAMGDKFSLPKFHEVVLGDGTLPLSLLEAKVNAWIAASK